MSVRTRKGNDLFKQRELSFMSSKKGKIEIGTMAYKNIKRVATEKWKRGYFDICQSFLHDTLKRYNMHVISGAFTCSNNIPKKNLQQYEIPITQSYFIVC